MYTFPKRKRLLQAAQYDAVFSQGKKIVSSHFIFFYCENDVTCARLGLAISKKKVPQSHERQRVKRLVRETFRCRSLINVDVVVLVRRAVEQEKNASLLSQLGQVWDGLASV